MPALPGWTAFEALARFQAGDLAVGRRRLAEAWASGSIAALPHDQLYLSALMMWAELAFSATDEEVAEGLYALLAPYAGHCCFTGSSVYGPVSYPLGRLAQLAGRLPEAEAHLRSAEKMATSMRSPVFTGKAKSSLAAHS